MTVGDTMTVEDTMNPPVLITVAGALRTKWRRFAAMIIARPVGVAMHLRELSNPRLLPARCRLFRRSHVLVVRNHILVARDDVEVRPDRYL